MDNFVFVLKVEFQLNLDCEAFWEVLQSFAVLDNGFASAKFSQNRCEFRQYILNTDQHIWTVVSRTF